MSSDPIFLRKKKLKPIKFYATPETYLKFTQAVYDNDLHISDVLTQLMEWFVTTNSEKKIVIKEIP